MTVSVKPTLRYVVMLQVNPLFYATLYMYIRTENNPHHFLYTSTQEIVEKKYHTKFDSLPL